MYSYLEIEAIFRNCANWEDLENACNCFLWVMTDGDLSPTMRIFIAEQSQTRFREIENL